MIKKEKIRIAIAFASIVLSVASSVNAGGSPQKPIPVTGAKAWALGCPAIIMEGNRSRHDILATDEITPKVIQETRQLLNEWWGVRNRTELLDVLDWLDEEGGHRKSFDKTGKAVSDISEQQFQSVIAKCGDDIERRQELLIARQYYKQLGDKSILGWDYSRYIALCRWGYTAGYFTERQAWDKIMPVARKLQETFNSWEDLGKNYLIGRQFWSYKQTQRSGDYYQQVFERLLKNEDSPWKKYPWGTDLGAQQDPNSRGGIRVISKGR